MDNISEPTPLASQAERSSSGLEKGLRSSLTFGLISCGGVGAFLQGTSGTVAGLVPLAGLAERLSALSHDLWMCLLVVTLFFRRRRRKKTMK